MSEPRRMLHDDGDDLGASLLRSARKDGPSPHARRKTMIALGLATGVGATVTAVTTTGAASTLAKSSASVALMKWIGAGVIGGLVTVGAVAVVQSPKEPPAKTEAVANAPIAAPPGAAAQRSPSVVASAAPSDEAPKPSVVAEAPKPAPEAPKPSPEAPKPAEKPSLADEVAALDAAREALRSGNASQALRALDDHDRRFRGGMLGMEATVMRIEALVVRGDRATAARIGRAFLDAHPRSPHAPRVRSLLGLSEEP